MYCGDEIGALVADIGSSSARFGYAGEDAPKTIVPSVEGRLSTAEEGTRYVHGLNSFGVRRDRMELGFVLENGLVKDWDALERLWSFVRREELPSEALGLPLMLAAAPHESMERRADMLEVLFEAVGVPALYVARSSALAAFAAGRATACVVDLSASGCTVGPVLDGYQLNRAVLRSSRGGDFLDELVLESVGRPIPPRFLVKRQPLTAAGQRRELLDLPLTHESYSRYWVADVARDLRECVCEIPRVSLDLREVKQRLGDPPSYELPDGSAVHVEPQLHILPDVLFRSQHGEEDKDAGTADVEENGSISELVHAAVARCDLDCRKEMLGSVVLCGGLSLTKGMPERLGHELTKLVPSAFKVKVTAATSVERRFSSWIGGSILASLGSFQQLWLSKEEYDDLGPTLSERRFNC